MKKLILRFIVGFLAFTISITLVWTGGVFQILFPAFAKLSLFNSKFATQQNISEKSGKVQVRFKKFHYGKGWFAYFEIVNETSESVLYVGSRRKDSNYSDYCTLAVKHNYNQSENIILKIMDGCHHSTVNKLESLKPGESVIFDVWEQNVRDSLQIKDSKLNTEAQFGFEFFVGEDKRREILWSEKVIFPPDELR